MSQGNSGRSHTAGGPSADGQTNYKLLFRQHAVQRTFERNIQREDVRHLLRTGMIIRQYPDDTPYPSRLVLGWLGDRPVHVVAADNHEEEETIGITVYIPDPSIWDVDFRRKRQ